MLLRRHERQHKQMKRLHYEDPAPTPALGARDPLLGLGLTINIALPLLPTIGITIGGSKTTSTTAPANSPAPTSTAPATTTTTTSSNGGGSSGGTGSDGSNSGGSNNGNGGSDNSGSNNGNGGGSSSTSGGSTTANSPASSASAPASNSSGIPSTDSSSGNTPSTDGQTPDNSSGGDSTTNTPNNLAGSAGFPNQAGSNGDDTGGSSSEGSSGSSGSSGGVTGVVNAGVIPGTTSVSGSRALVSQTNGGTIAAPTSTNTGDNTGDKEHGGNVGSSSKIAGTAIGIILALLFLLGLLLLLRRHRRAKRNQQLNKWWFTRKRTSRSYNDDKLMVQTPACPPSARSSFATNIDHSNSFEVNFNTPLPAMPPTAELRMSRNDLQYPAPATAESGPPVDPRFSLGSVNSSDSHYLFVSHRPSFETNDLNHTGSINALTPLAERFAFPKPPSDASSEISNRISGTEETAKTYVTPNTSPTPPEHQNLPPLANPFADTAGHMSTFTHTTDPFSDSTASTSHAHGTAESDSVNPPVPVTRPFASRAADEVTLMVGDQVKVHQIFDDGWALVDKLEDGAAMQRGLVPIACLR